MGTIKIPAESLRDPLESRVPKFRIEPALDCDGGICCAWTGIIGEDSLPEIDPHFHLVVLGEEPKAGPRYVPFFGEPPEFEHIVRFLPYDPSAS